MASTDMPDGRPSGSQFDRFMAEIVALARAVAPELALMLDPDRTVPASPWSGSRARGVRLCASMLRYARLELATDGEATRLEAAIAFAETELAALGERAQDAPSNADVKARFDEIELALRRARGTGEER